MTPFPPPIVAAYEQSGAFDIPCPHCGADIGVVCTRPDGRVRRAPCVARCRISSPAVGSSDPEHDSEPAEARSGLVDLDAPPLWHDPSEPRHPRGDE